MKNLIYSTVLLSIFLMIASCSKKNEVQPSDVSLHSATGGTPATTIVTACDSTSLTGFNLTNYTDDNSYVVEFYGPATYTFNIPASGGKRVNIKPGVYSLIVHPTSEDRINKNFYLDGTLFSSTQGGRINGVKINPCSAQLLLLIK